MFLDSYLQSKTSIKRFAKSFWLW